MSTSVAFSFNFTHSDAGDVCVFICHVYYFVHVTQGDHLSGKPGKPGNVREFGTCQGNVRDVVNSQGIVREMSGKKSWHGKVSQNCSLLDE